MMRALSHGSHVPHLWQILARTACVRLRVKHRRRLFASVEPTERGVSMQVQQHTHTHIHTTQSGPKCRSGQCRKPSRCSSHAAAACVVVWLGGMVAARSRSSACARTRCCIPSDSNRHPSTHRSALPRVRACGVTRWVTRRREHAARARGEGQFLIVVSGRHPRGRVTHRRRGGTLHPVTLLRRWRRRGPRQRCGHVDTRELEVTREIHIQHAPCQHGGQYGDGW